MGLFVRCFVILLYNEFPPIQEYLHSLHIDISNEDFDSICRTYLALSDQHSEKTASGVRWHKINPITKKDKEKIAQSGTPLFENMVRIESVCGANGFESFLEEGYEEKPFSEWPSIVIPCQNFTFFCYVDS